MSSEKHSVLQCFSSHTQPLGSLWSQYFCAMPITPVRNVRRKVRRNDVVFLHSGGLVFCGVLAMNAYYSFVIQVRKVERRALSSQCCRWEFATRKNDRVNELLNCRITVHVHVDLQISLAESCHHVGHLLNGDPTRIPLEVCLLPLIDVIIWLLEPSCTGLK